jgi:hypothetical protein
MESYVMQSVIRPLLKISQESLKAPVIERTNYLLHYLLRSKNICSTCRNHFGFGMKSDLAVNACSVNETPGIHVILCDL